MNRNLMVNAIFVILLLIFVYMAYALVDAPAENKQLKKRLEESQKRYDSLELEKNKYFELSVKLYIEAQSDADKAINSKENQLKTKEEYENLINIISTWNANQVDSFFAAHSAY